MIDLHFCCADCRGYTPAREARHRCHCGGLFEPRVYAGASPTIVAPSAIPEIDALGRYPSPQLRRNLGGMEVFVKYEAALPTGSYKDRGARALIGVCRAYAIPRVVEDSSGNAGAAIAAYAAAAGIEAEIFVREGASPVKVRQIAAYGARVTSVSGTREDVARAARSAAGTSAVAPGAAGAAYYASHVYNPLFIAGVQSAADEIVDQIGIPDAVYLPVGNGSLILGLAEGFRRHGGLPRFVAVQAAAVSPVYDAWRRTRGALEEARETTVPAGPPAGRTIADGVAVAAPARPAEIVALVNESGGTVLTASDDAIRAAQRELGGTGLYAEPTGALAAAGYLGLRRHPQEETAVVFVTGSGLKEQP